MRNTWRLHQIIAYRRYAILSGVLAMVWGILTSLLLLRLPYGEALVIVGAFPLSGIIALSFLCAQRAHGVLREIDAVIAPTVEVLLNLRPEVAAAVMAQARQIREEGSGAPPSNDPSPPTAPPSSPVSQPTLRVIK